MGAFADGSLMSKFLEICINSLLGWRPRGFIIEYWLATKAIMLTETSLADCARIHRDYIVNVCRNYRIILVRVKLSSVGSAQEVHALPVFASRRPVGQAKRIHDLPA